MKNSYFKGEGLIKSIWANPRLLYPNCCSLPGLTFAVLVLIEKLTIICKSDTEMDIKLQFRAHYWTKLWFCMVFVFWAPSAVQQNQSRCCADSKEGGSMIAQDVYQQPNLLVCRLSINIFFILIWMLSKASNIGDKKEIFSKQTIKFSYILLK